MEKIKPKKKAVLADSEGEVAMTPKEFKAHEKAHEKAVERFKKRKSRKTKPSKEESSKKGK